MTVISARKLLARFLNSVLLLLKLLPLNRRLGF